MITSSLGALKPLPMDIRPKGGSPFKRSPTWFGAAGLGALGLLTGAVLSRRGARVKGSAVGAAIGGIGGALVGTMMDMAGVGDRTNVFVKTHHYLDTVHDDVLKNRDAIQRVS